MGLFVEVLIVLAGVYVVAYSIVQWITTDDPDGEAHHDEIEGTTGWVRWLWFSSPAFRHYVAAALLLVGIALDTITTGVLLESGKVIEGNNLLRPVYRTTGVMGIVAVKLAVVGAGVTVFRVVVSRRWAEWMKGWFYAACGTAWTLAGAWNTLVGVVVFGL